MIVKKAEHEEMKAELEKQKDELYQVNIKIKSVENQANIAKRDHKDEIDRITSDLMEENKVKYEELIIKHSEERNRLIEESNKTDDDKMNILQQQHADLQKEKEQLEEKLKQTIDDMIEAH